MFVAKLLLIAILLCVIAWLVVRVVRSARRLDERIREYGEERDKQPLTDPYSALAELLKEDDNEAQKK